MTKISDETPAQLTIRLQNDGGDLDEPRFASTEEEAARVVIEWISEAGAMCDGWKILIEEGRA